MIWMILIKRFQSHLYEIFSPHVRRETIFPPQRISYWIKRGAGLSGSLIGGHQKPPRNEFVFCPRAKVPGGIFDCML